MEPTIRCGTQLALHAKLTGSRFEDVCLGQAQFENVNLAGARFHDINFSDVSFSAAQIGGCVFRHIGLPPGTAGHQRPVRFEEADLNGLVLRDCNLAGASIENCNTEGLTIDGVPYADLLAAYQKNTNGK